MVAIDKQPPRRPRLLIGVVSLLLATAVWLSLVHFFFQPRLEDFRQPKAVAPQARQMAARHLKLWEDPARRAAEIARMRASNAEWDFMGRTYLVLALANMALSEPHEQSRYLSVIDAIIDETVALEQSRGMRFFLMDYARHKPFVAQPARSTFVDGEIALMLAARQLVQAEPRFAAPLAARIDVVVQSMSQGPVLCGESYPDECWMFCNALAAAAIHISDRLDGRDHSAFIQRWLAMVKAKLVDRRSGLVVSSFTYDGRHLDGPEGSSLWMIAHCLQLIDPVFAGEQYRLARQQIGRQVLGFGYAQERPPTWQGPMDVDSGPIVPLVGASAGSSGSAVLGAAAFGDNEYLRSLLTSLQFAAFPIRHDGELRYAASNQVGDAVLTYALVAGPLWERAAASTTAAKKGQP